MPRPLAYFLTWTTYGSWLPGDSRGWVHHSDGAWHVPFRQASPALEASAKESLKGTSVVLTTSQRDIIAKAIEQCCGIRRWQLRALNVRSNHVHLVVAAGDVAPQRVMTYFKTWASRLLNERTPSPSRRRWWTRHGSTRYLNSPNAVRTAVKYVLNQ